MISIKKSALHQDLKIHEEDELISVRKTKGVTNIKT